MQVEANGTRNLKPCKGEMRHPEVDWPATWTLSNMKGLNPTEKTFLGRMLHNLLPTQARLFHLKIKNILHPNCLLCDRPEPADLSHSLLTCPFNMEVYTWLIGILQTHIPQLQQVVLLHLGPLDEDLCLPLVWLISNTLSLLSGMIGKKRKSQGCITQDHL